MVISDSFFLIKLNGHPLHLMNQLLVAGVFVILGIILLVVHHRKEKSKDEKAIGEIPYLRNAGYGFILFGIYYLVRFFMV